MSVRKRIIGRVLSREKSTTQEPKKLGLSDLELYIEEVCDCIERKAALSEELVEKSSEMLGVLDRSLEEIPNFSTDFYSIVKRILQGITVQDYKGLTKDLLKLGVFLKGDQQPANLLEEIEARGQSFDTRILTDFAADLKNSEPYKTICLALLYVYASVDEQITEKFTHFGSKAVKFIREYLKRPMVLLGHLKSTAKYLTSMKIFVENSKVLKYKGVIIHSPSRKIYEFLGLVLKYYEQHPNNCSVIFEVGTELESTSKAIENSEFFTTDDSMLSEKQFYKLDQAILQTKNILKASPVKPYTPVLRTSSPFISNFRSFEEDPSFKEKLKEAQQVRDKFKNNLHKILIRKPTTNLLACKDKLIAEFEGNLNWNERKHCKGLRGDSNFRNIVKEVHRNKSKEPEMNY